MSLLHGMVSTAEDDGDENAVQGSHWNAPHVYGPGEVLLAGAATIYYEAIGNTLSMISNTSRILGVTPGETWPMSIEFDVSDIPLAHNCEAQTLAAISVVGAQPAGHVAEVFGNAAPIMVLMNTDTGPIDRFANSATIFLQLFVEVVRQAQES